MVFTRSGAARAFAAALPREADIVVIGAGAAGVGGALLVHHRALELPVGWQVGGG